MEGWTVIFVARKMRACSLSNLETKLVGGAAACLCLLTPLPTSLIHHSLHSLAEVCSALLDYMMMEQPPFQLSTSAFTFLICNLIVLAIIVTSSIQMAPPSKTSAVPYNFLHFPFMPIQAISFTSSEYCIKETSSLSTSCISGPACSPFVYYSQHGRGAQHIVASEYPSELDALTPTYSPFAARRSRSHQSLITSSPQPTTLVEANRTPSRSPFHNTVHLNKLKLPAFPTYNLTDKEIDQRFSAFIEHRFATMQKEMMDQ